MNVDKIFDEVIANIQKRIQTDPSMKMLINRNQDLAKRLDENSQDIQKRQIEIARQEWIKALTELGIK